MTKNQPLIRGDLSLEFFDGQVLFRSKDQYKFLSAAAVTAAFRNAPVDTGWLPAGVIRCGGSGRGDFAILFLEARRHQLTLEGRARPLLVPLPSLVFFGIGREFFVWATKTNRPEPNALLFHAPLPNVFDSGRICWGSNKPPRAGVKTILPAWDLFITSPFNSHAAQNKSRKYPNDARQLLRSLGRSKSFPLGDLRDFRRQLDNEINSLIGGSSDDGNFN